jgi:hypothetical protein
MGTKITGVVQTGDFESKHSDTILEIYRRLSEGGGLLPPAIGFIFDRENRTERERQDLKRRSGEKVAFTERRMFENYLLDPRAIAHVASGIEGFREDGEVTNSEVEEWIQRSRWDEKYFAQRVEEAVRTEQMWLNEVDGARFLKDMFADLSETRVPYDKVVHGVRLTQWLCDNAPEQLEELAQLITGRLTQNGAS